MTTAPNELITAHELELHAVQQQVAEMRIVETAQGYELQVPLRAWIPNQMAIKDNKEVVIPLTEPRWRTLRTRRAQEPRKFKKLSTIFGYIEEQFPSVRNVRVVMLDRTQTEQPNTPTTTAGQAKPKRAGNRSDKKANKRKAK